jgi:hypothetical protein
MDHKCLKNGKPTGALGPDRPSWAEPGAVTKIADEDRWGRVDLLWKCCGARQVTLQAEGQEWFETLCLPVDALENPVGAHRVPAGVLLPTPWPRGRS